MSFINPEIRVGGIVFQNSHGSKYYSHYYDSDNSKTNAELKQKADQEKFEQSLLSKVKRMNIIATLKPEQTEIFTLSNHTILFKVIDELQIYLIVPDHENFVLMQRVIDTLGEVLLKITKGPYTGKVIFDYLQDIVLAVDEIIHEGYIMCLDAQKVFDRLRMKEGTEGKSDKKAPTTQQPPQQGSSGGTFSSLFGFAKNTFGKTLNLG